MNHSETINQPALSTANGKAHAPELPLITVVCPAYNEEAIITNSLTKLCAYLSGLEDRFRWEILVVNDGSKDNTAQLADDFAAQHDRVRVIHHDINRNLGGGIRTGFANARGEFIVVMDMDLSYEETHIERLMDKMLSEGADIVVASPYMKGGKNTKVPRFRLVLSKVVNKVMSWSAPNTDLDTFTSMVRAYRTSFIRGLNLKSNTYSINPEIIFKALILRARIYQIPAHLDWSFQEEAPGRVSSVRVIKGILAGLMSSFMFRPYGFFMMLGTIFLLVALWVTGWIFAHTFDIYGSVEVASGMFNDRFTEAVRQVYTQRPHAFIVGGFTWVLALQFFGIAFMSLQNKRYFDELFHINSTQYKELLELNQKN